MVIDLARARPEELALALGPSGNLRAPAVRVAKDWLVGFDGELWTRWLDARA